MADTKDEGGSIAQIEKAETSSNGYHDPSPTTVEHHVDAEAEKRLVRKFDFNIVPLVFGLCK